MAGERAMAGREGWQVPGRKEEPTGVEEPKTGEWEKGR